MTQRRQHGICSNVESLIEARGCCLQGTDFCQALSIMMPLKKDTNVRNVLQEAFCRTQAMQMVKQKIPYIADCHCRVQQPVGKPHTASLVFENVHVL